MGKVKNAGESLLSRGSLPPTGGPKDTFVRSSVKDGEDYLLCLDFSRAEILGFCPETKGETSSLRLKPASGGFCASMADNPIVLSFGEGSPLEVMRLFSCEYRAGAGSDPDSLVFGGTMKLVGRDALLLSFDCLHFFGLALPFDLESSTEIKGGSVSVSPEGSMAREGSLAKQFNLKPKSLLFSSAEKITEKGFEGLEGDFAPPEPAPAKWAAVVCSIAMGKLGDLAESAELAAEIALGFCPGSTSAFAGIKLPGADLLGRVGLQGMVGLKPSELSLQLLDGPSWLLWVRGISLSLFGLRLPPGGHVEAMLRGDPSGKGPPSWYCAYAPSGS